MERVSIEAFRYARSVWKSGSFSAAARSQNVSQPGLSNGIAKLEERLGDRLFERSTRGVQPTVFGLEILPLIDRALVAVDAVGSEARRLTATGDEFVRVGVSPLIDPSLVAAIYEAVHRQTALGGPRQLVMREANMAELRDALLANQLDLVLMPSVGFLQGYEHRIVASEPLVVVGGHEGDDVPLSLNDLQGAELILMPDTCGLTAFTRDLVQAHKLRWKPYAGEAASYRVLEEWANLGLGSAIVPLSKLTSPETPHRSLRADGEDVEIFYQAVWDPGSPLADDLHRLADLLSATTQPH
ncbi:LysR family transcriptional regulator [Nocardioides sp. YIM 152315]|uniref:LysR family transcriptional regulator n=1 Tax=Nocardioides sp. YIM 152315 TaxID=3031760 RepID=UPI0023DB088D|nr:LysR family transcriptional regulator [Nocardioides sp. YIM 152315]MDF1605858.1 LysR family transcriptional regulator [Nocardioides sp. YIM 152315]